MAAHVGAGQPRRADAAVDAGINFVDTADVYGGPQSPDMEQGYGISEEYIGRWLALGSGRRDKIVLATKLYQPMGAGPNDRGLSASHIRTACEDSLRRLGTDHIDLYQMHHVDRSTSWEEIWQAMEQLVWMMWMSRPLISIRMGFGRGFGRRRCGAASRCGGE